MMKGDWKTIIFLILLFAGLTAPVWWKSAESNLTRDNQEIATAILIAAIGSAAGALGGAFISERNQNQKLLVEEFRNTNAAIMIAFGIFNSLINLKIQFALPFRDEFYDAKAELEVINLTEGNTGIRSPFYYRANLATMQQSRYPTEALEKILFEKISLSGRPVTLLSVLSNTLHSLNNSIDFRNQLVEGLKALKVNGTPEEMIVQVYFGVPLASNSVDMSYTNSIDNIYNSTNDAIFFSKLLCTDLIRHVRQLRELIDTKNKKIYEPDFASVDIRLMPDESRYANWIDNFK